MDFQWISLVFVRCPIFPTQTPLLISSSVFNFNPLILNVNTLVLKVIILLLIQYALVSRVELPSASDEIDVIFPQHGKHHPNRRKYLYSDHRLSK